MSTAKAYQYGQVPNPNGSDVQVIRTGNKKFDKFVSRYGGLVRATWMFLTGTAGAGKTTLIVFLQSLFKNYKTVLWSLEMPAASVERQCGRFNASHGNAFIADGESCPTFDEFMALLEREKPDVIAIDSIQMVAKLLRDEMGEDKAIEHVMEVLRSFNVKNNSVLIFIGQMTKGGVFKGPQEILQLADAHMEMTYYAKRKERVISWGGKNRNCDDPSEKMFYTFGAAELNFYSPAEWDILKRKLTFAGFMLDAATTYLTAMKDREGYSEVSKKLRVVENKLKNTCQTEDQFFFALAQEINNAVTIAWPVAA